MRGAVEPTGPIFDLTMTHHLDKFLPQFGGLLDCRTLVLQFLDKLSIGSFQLFLAPKQKPSYA